MGKSVKRSLSKKSKGTNKAKSKKSSNGNNTKVKGKKSKKSGGKLGPIELNDDKLDKNRFYCVKCRGLCFSRKPDVKVGASKKGRNMLRGVCKTCGTKVVRFFS
jgi:hypothetical protein